MSKGRGPVPRAKAGSVTVLRFMKRRLSVPWLLSHVGLSQFSFAPRHNSQTCMSTVSAVESEAKPSARAVSLLMTLVAVHGTALWP